MDIFNQKLLEDAYNHYLEKRIDLAKEICIELIKNKVNDEKLFSLLSLIELSLNNLENSNKYISKAILINPNSSELLNNLGFILLKQKKLDQSREVFEKILKIDIENITAINNLAHVLLKLKNYKKSIIYFQKLVILEKNNTGHVYWLGYSYFQIKDYINAKKIFENYLINHPKDTSALINLSYIYQYEKNYTKAIEILNHIFSYDEKNFQAHNNLGLIYKDQHNYFKAIYHLIKSIKINNSNFIAYVNLGIILQEKRKFLFAKKIYETAYKIQSDDKHLAGRLLHIKNIICDWDNIVEIKKQIKDNLKKNKETTPSFVCLSNFDDEIIHLKSAIKWSENFSAISNTSNIEKQINNKKLNIGFFSADFREHAMSYILAGLFEKLDHKKFNYYAFYLGPKNTTLQKKRIKQSFKNFYEFQNLNKLEIFNFIKNLNLDLAIDLTGYTQHSFTDLFASNIAKKKINYLGYPGSLGLKCFDYIIADEIIIPKKNFKNYIEEVLHMNHCYQPNDKHRFFNLKKIKKHELDLPSDKFIFGNFNNSFKITREIFDIWLSLLEKNNNSILLLLESISLQRENILKYSTNKKLEKKIFFIKRSEQSCHLSKHQVVDLFLDTFPYNGHVSASDALMMGVPYLALQGNSFHSRVSSSILNELKLNELICHNYDDYFSKAYELSVNEEKYTELKLKIEKNILNCKYLDMQRFAESIENIFLRIGKQ